MVVAHTRRSLGRGDPGRPSRWSASAARTSAVAPPTRRSWRRRFRFRPWSVSAISAGAFAPGTRSSSTETPGRSSSGAGPSATRPPTRSDVAFRIVGSWNPEWHRCATCPTVTRRRNRDHRSAPISNFLARKSIAQCRFRRAGDRAVPLGVPVPLSRTTDSDEDEHERTYREIAAKAAPHPVVIRTFDLGGEKYFHQVLQPEEGQRVLGLRGIRLCLRRPDIFLRSCGVCCAPRPRTTIYGSCSRW